MTRFLDTALEIHDWLTRLQVRQQSICARIENGRLRFALEHPVDGTIRADVPMPDRQMFQSHGVALRLGQKRGEDIDLEVYDSGGIFDPIDGRVQGEHYSATHFALLSAILYRELGERRFLEDAQQAIEFHLRTSADEYYFSDWMYHWDFQNYAFLLTLKLLRKDLSAAQEQEWSAALLDWRTNHRNKLTNWAAMRAWAYLERYRLFGRPSDYLRYRLNLHTVGRARQADGCFDDSKNMSRPIQYHIFTIAILHRILQLKPSRTVRSWFNDGIAYFLPFIDPEGDFNYVGRGQEQIFGYGAAIYALEAAYHDSHDDRFLELSDALFSFLQRHKRNGHFPLVLNSLPDRERGGWYDYHHLTVYNAFLGAWLGLAHLLGNSRVSRPQSRRLYIKHWRPTRTLIVSKNSYFAVFTGGLEEYASEPAVTPHHLWWRDVGRMFSCPGGPTGERHGERANPGSERNMLAPMYKHKGRWVTPAGRSAGRFDFDGRRLGMELRYPTFSLIRTVEFQEDTLHFADEFRFDVPFAYEELRIFNFPVPIDELTIGSAGEDKFVVSNGSRSIEVVVEDSDFTDTRFEILERLQVARGWVELVGKRFFDISFEAGEKRRFCFSVRTRVKESSKKKDEGRLSELPV